MNIEDRVNATQKTLDKFIGREFVWGESDCITIARAHFVHMGKSVPRIRNYRNVRQALRRLNQQGADSVEELLGQYTVEIPPAMLLPGDLATIRGDTSLSAVVICAGRKFLGFPSETGIFSVLELRPERGFHV